tara:strand:+ start:35 stop:301 length:267 start_codon:yes stop_codon:yes gene_type:complete
MFVVLLIDILNPIRSNIVGVKSSLKDAVTTLLEIAHCRNGGDTMLEMCFADKGPLEELKLSLMKEREIRLDGDIYKICDVSNIKLEKV